MLVLICSTGKMFSQDVPLETTVQAGFGIDADIYDEMLSFNTNGLTATGTDDWVDTPPDMNPSTGAGVITNPTGSVLADLLAGANVPVELRMSAPIYSYPEGPGAELWIDAVYYRDQRTNGSNLDMSVFEQDINKNFNDPTTWNFTTGSVPQKNDIIDVFAHLRRDAISDDEFAIVGASTRSNNGDSYIDFEYYRSDVALNAEGDALVSEGPDCGHTAYEFDLEAEGAVLTHGDIIMSVDFTQGGKKASIALYVWVSAMDFPNEAAFASFNAEMDARPFDFGDGSGNYEYHSDNVCGFGYARISLRADEDEQSVFAQVNSEPVAAPGWKTIDSGGNVTDFYDQNTFFEIAINATLFGFDTRSTLGECQSPLGSLLVKTRSSDSFTASLKDFAGPFDLGRTPEVTVTVENGEYECFETSTDLTAVTTPVGATFEFQWFELIEGVYQEIPEATDNTLEDVSEGTYKVTATIQLGGRDGCTATQEGISVIQQNPANPLDAFCSGDLIVDGCTSPEELSAAFDAWLNGGEYNEVTYPGFTYSGGGGEVTATYTVDGVVVENFDQLIPPNNCEGGETTLGISVVDECGQSDECFATFNVTPAEALDISDVQDISYNACDFEDQDALDTAFATWLAGFSVDGGCDPQTSGLADLTAPTLCDGGSVSVTFSVTDLCESGSDSATFRVIPDIEAPVITPPIVENVCETDVPASLTATWTDNCSDGGEITAFPELVGGDECSEVYEYTFNVTDACGNAAEEEVVTIVREIELVDNCETIFAYNEATSECFSEYGFNRWGWTNSISANSTTVFDLYGGAGQCDITKGTRTGTATVVHDGSAVTVTYNMFSEEDRNFVLNEAHVYIGCEPIPTMENGKETVAPGQFNFNPDLGGGVQNYTVGPVEVNGGGDVYVIIHGVACEILCECSDSRLINGSEGGNAFDGASINCDNDDSDSADNDSGNGNGKGNGRNKSTAISGFDAYPVPFNEVINVKYDFEYESNVEIQIFDMRGKFLRKYKDNKVTAGDVTTLNVDFALKANQMYVVKLVTDREVFVKQIVSSSKK